jgi:uncharacterized protein (DUF927 family)
MNDSTDDTWSRLSDQLRATAPGGQPPRNPGTEAAGEYIDPVPADGPPPLTSHRQHGEPSQIWTYRNEAGEVRFHVARFDAAAGSKVVLPMTLWRSAKGLRWEWKASPAPRSLYGLADLAGRPDAPALIVEGEKAADAAAAHFPDFVAVTWPGGSKAVAKADWGPLAGRRAIIWPDADEPGDKAARAVARELAAIGAASPAIVALPAGLSEGWDLADPWPPGFGLPAALAAIDAAREDPGEAAEPIGVVWPWGFRMERAGLFFDTVTRDATVPQRLSDPFEVLAEARSPAGDGWSVIIRFRDRDGREKIVPIERSRLTSGGAEVRAELADAGLIFSGMRSRAEKFSQALAEVKSSRRETLATATGWCGAAFVIPGAPCGPAAGESVRFIGRAEGLHYRRAGSLAAWREEIAAKAEGNALLTFALSLAFAGPLLRPLGLEGGGVHFRGSSSCGKTTLALAAGSVWGGGGALGFGHTWRSTANALEGVATGHNDTLLVLDELALVSPDEAGMAAYSLATGQSKGRAQTSGALRRRTEWRVIIISTGEVGLADHIRTSRRGERPMAGQELRLLDVSADPGAYMGVWETLHGAAGGAALSDAIKAAASRHYGHAGAAFVERFRQNPRQAEADAKAILKGFLERAREAGDTGQAERAAVRFGLAATAGELASAFGIVPWPPGAAIQAAMTLYRRWGRSFGRSALREERDILRRLQEAILRDRSRFSPLGDDDTGDDSKPSPGGRDGEQRSLTSLGHRWVRGLEVRYCFHAAGWSEVFKACNPSDAARIVHEAGFLETGEDKSRLQKRISVRGEKQRLYCVKSSILDVDLDDGQ